jgi:lipopolysaccharide transport system permease protein
MQLILEAGRADRHYWRDLWAYRELFLVLAWRDISVRYRQMVFGVAWAILRPLLTVSVFTIVFSRLAKLPSPGAAPYPIMVFAGMLPWFLISGILGDVSNSVVGNAALIGKVYFPRMILPAAGAVTALVDFAINLAILLAVMIGMGDLPGWRVLLLPGFVMLGICVGLGPSLFCAALNVKYRDFRYIIPFGLQLGLYVSPVGFSSSVVPGGWRFWYDLNPAVGVIDGFRWCLLADGSPFNPISCLTSVVETAIILCFGIAYFRRTERNFADLI